MTATRSRKPVSYIAAKTMKSETCFVCGRSGVYYKLTGSGLKRVGGKMKDTERGRAHEDCLA